MGPALLELSGISKSFGGVQALRADFSLKVGEIHGLVGENGAGKEHADEDHSRRARRL